MFKQLWQKLTRREDRPEAEQAAQPGPSTRPRLSTAELASLPDSGLMQANHRFAFKLWLALQARDPGANLFFSPLSISMVLALLAQGARGLSRTELETVLGTAGLPPEELLKDCQTLMRFLQLQGRGVELRLANSLWLPQQLALEPDFQALARQVFQAEAVNLDFSSPQALAEINAWASTQTHGRIASILNSLDPDAVLILLNAIWFKGSWQEPFLPAATRPEPFQRASGDSVSAATMVQRLECRHRLLEGRCQVLALNYGLEAQASFYALLPEPGVSLQSLLQELSPETWEQWRLGLYQRMVTVHLPRFRLAWEAELNAVLAALGLDRIFTDAPGLEALLKQPQPLQVSLIKHKSFVDVSETGTEAAAVTAVAVRAQGMPPPPLEVRLDRPFLFLIVDEWSGSILFAGTLNDPTE